MKKLRAFTKFLRLGDAILSVALLVSLALIFYIKNTDVRSYLMNVSASFLFAGIIRGVELYREIFCQIHFVRFFGDRIAQNDFSIVYPEFGLDFRMRNLAECNGIKPQKLFVKNNQKINLDDDFRVDLESCVASNDLRAMIELSSLFAKRIHEPTKITPDRDWEHILEESFVSVGFSSNYVTHKWLGMAKGLINVAVDDNNQRYGEFVNIKVNEAGKNLEVGQKSSITEGEVGLVVKFRPDPDDRPDIIWFLCAGIGGDATVGSAVFLSRKWPKLLKLFDEKDFILVVRTPPGVAMHPVPIFAATNGQSVDIGRLR